MAPVFYFRSVLPHISVYYVEFNFKEAVCQLYFIKPSVSAPLLCRKAIIFIFYLEMIKKFKSNKVKIGFNLTNGGAINEIVILGK